MSKAQESGWFTAGNDIEVLTPIAKLNQDRDKWELMRPKTSDHGDKLRKPSTNSGALVLYSVTKMDVQKQIIRLVDDGPHETLQSREACKSYLKTANDAYKDLKSARASSTRRTAFSGFQRFLCAIADFLESFSGVAEIVKGADQQYGGLAFGTISLLVSVAAHKQRTEEAIQDALEELSYAFPRLEALETLRPNDRLRGLIAKVFELVICFCREIVEYLTHMRRRIAHALNPNAMKMKTLSQLRISLGEIRKECEITVLEQLHQIQHQLGAIQLTGNDTNSRVKESQAWMQEVDTYARKSHLDEIRQLLRLKRQDIETSASVANYKSVLNNVFAERRRKQKAPQDLSSRLFMEERAYSAWSEQSQSSILILGGSNWPVDSSVQLNWLSYASVFVAESTKDPLVFLCQTSYTISKRLQRSFSDVVRSLVYQIVEQHPGNLQSQKQDITELLHSPEWQEAECSVVFEAMAQLLVKLLAAIDAGTELVFVIDRLDRCRWDDDPQGNVGELVHAVASLLDVIRDRSVAHLRIKMLLVMDSGPAREVAKTLDWASLRQSLYSRVDWDQEKESAA